MRARFLFGVRACLALGGSGWCERARELTSNAAQALADLQRRWVSDSAALAQTIETRDDQLQRLRLALHNAPVPPSSATLADASGGDAQASGDGGLLGARRTTMSASDVPVGLADPSTNAGDAAGGAAPVPVAAAAGAGAGAGVGVGVGLRAQSWRQQPLVPGQMFGSSGAGDALGAAYGAAYAQRPLSLPDDGLLGDGLGAAGGAFTPGGASADEWTTAQRVLGASSSSSLSEEIEQQRRAAALTRAALDLKRSELGQRADDFHARLANVDDIFATPASAAPVSAPLGSAFQAFAFTGGSSRTLSPPPAARVDASMASLPRTTSHASAPPAPLGSAQRIDSLQSEIDVLRQQIMSRLTSPRQSGASLAAAPDTAASQRVGVGRTRTQASYTPASRAGGAFESPALSSSHAASRASTASSFVRCGRAQARVRLAHVRCAVQVVRDRTSVYDTTSAAVRSEVHARVRETHAD
jgi:hypothetical protein